MIITVSKMSCGKKKRVPYDSRYGPVQVRPKVCVVVVVAWLVDGSPVDQGLIRLGDDYGAVGVLGT